VNQPPHPAPVADRGSTAIDWVRFVQLIRAQARFVLTTHIRPDCDALGSTLGMAAVLESLGKQVRIVAAFEVPPTFRFLDPGRKIQRLGHDVVAGDLEDAEVLMVLDTSAWAQLGEMGEVIRTTRAKKVVIDHHVSSDDLGAEEFRNTAAEATGRLVVEAADQLGVPLTPEVAAPLFAALATDTGWFRFSSTSGDTYRLAGRLTDAGAVPDQLFRRLYENDSLARLRLTGRVLGRVQTELDGRLIYTWIERTDFEATGALPSDSEDLINMTLMVAGTEAAVILVEQVGGGFKVSFRSRRGLDCSRLAEQFGGGGHKKAAGAFLREPLAAARSRVLDAVRGAMQ
jgi:phosphoesterase RecJ-like protein